MKHMILAFGLALVGFSACTHAVDEADAGATQTYTPIEQFAVQSVYEAHPTRALVDKIELVPSAGAHTLLRIEMTGAPEFRKSYQLEISESVADGFKLEDMQTLQ
ncbi:MAG: hypothetical protein AAF437_05240 [Pseudomonadota bacterium]